MESQTATATCTATVASPGGQGGDTCEGEEETTESSSSSSSFSSSRKFHKHQAPRFSSGPPAEESKQRAAPLPFVPQWTAPKVEPPRQGYFYIDTPQTLASAAHFLASVPIIAVDCEGVRLGRFGQLCLIQVSTPLSQIFDNHFCYLIDVLALGPKTTALYLGPIFSAQHIIKVMHDCCEDSSSLYNQLGIYLQSVFDTQLAFEILYKEPNIGLKQMLTSVVDVMHSTKESVNKLMQEDPNLWLKRPLPATLLKYACDDVSMLLKAYVHFTQYLNVPHFLNNCQNSRVNYCSLNIELFPAQIFHEQSVVGLVRCIKPERSVAFIHLNLGVRATLENDEDISYLQEINGLGQYFRFYVEAMDGHCVYLRLDNTLLNYSDCSSSFYSETMEEGMKVAEEEEERERDDHRLHQRQKQIDFGKNTREYKRYIRSVTKEERDPCRSHQEHPLTPDKYKKISKRKWDLEMRQWRRLLHEYYDDDQERKKKNDRKKTIKERWNKPSSSGCGNRPKRQDS